MNYLLHIDTSGNTGTIAISGDGKILSTKTSTDARNQAALINIMINDALAAISISLVDLAGVVVCAGPGSYTGLRIGMATAKALCYVLDKPLFLHNKLTLLANQAYKATPGYNQYIALLKAREKEYFIAAYNNNFDCLIEPQHMVELQINTLFEGNTEILVIGDVNDDIIKNLIISDIHIITSSEVDLNNWAAFSYSAYKCNENVNLSAAEPFYLKQAYTTK